MIKPVIFNLTLTLGIIFFMFYKFGFLNNPSLF